MGNKIATREAYGKALVKLSNMNKDVVVLDADLSKSTKTADFKAAAPERFINMGIAEANMMGVASGLSTCGKIPFVSTFAMFAAGRAFEQIRNSICYPKLNVKVCATHAGLTVGEDGASHQSVEDISLMRSIPNMTVINPADAIETEAAILAVAEYKGPCYVRLGRLAVENVNDNANYKFEIGKGVTLANGNDVTIVATGIMVKLALEAKEELAKDGIDARVINIHTIKPIDSDLLIKAAKET
ncbi:transketolase family protein, partial [Clostridium botulinum]|nr:transketolase family protein [Clostridium botulinum]